MNLNSLAEQRIESAFVAANAKASPSLPSIYASFNQVAARLVDELHECAAHDDMLDYVSIKMAEREIIATCYRRAAELVSNFSGGSRT